MRLLLDDQITLHFTDLKDRSGFGQESVFNINLLSPTFLDTQFFQGQNVNYCHLDNVLPDLNLGCINDTQPFAFVFGFNGLALQHRRDNL